MSESFRNAHKHVNDVDRSASTCGSDAARRSTRTVGVMATLMPPGTAIRAGAAYFALVFGAGFLLGSVRVPFLVPRIGERLAELLEAPVMLVVIFCASRYVVRRHGLTTRTAVAAGLLALALLVAAELALSVAMFDRSVSEYISRRDPVSGSVYLASLLLYAALPWLHARRHDRASA